VDAAWCDCAKASFAGVVGPNARFGGAALVGCGLLGCDLSGADFSNADLTGVTFDACTLAGANFTNAYLTGARFEHCDLTGAVFTNPDVQRKGVWGDLAGVIFIDCRLGGALIQGANLEAKSRAFVRRRVTVFGDESIVYCRDGGAGGPGGGAPITTLQVPAAALIRCQFRYEPKKAGGPVGSGVDWSGAGTAGVLLDVATSQAMTAEERALFNRGGFDPDSVRQPRRYAGVAEEQYRELGARTWKSLSHLLSLMYGASDKGP
jgi:hypothetical protein